MKRIYIKPDIKTVLMCPHTFITKSDDAQTQVGGVNTGDTPSGEDIYKPSRYMWDDLLGEE